MGVLLSLFLVMSAKADGSANRDTSSAQEKTSEVDYSMEYLSQINADKQARDFEEAESKKRHMRLVEYYLRH